MTENDAGKGEPKRRTYLEQPGLESPHHRQLYPLLQLRPDERGLRREGQCDARHQPSIVM